MTPFARTRSFVCLSVLILAELHRSMLDSKVNVFKGMCLFPRFICKSLSFWQTSDTL